MWPTRASARKALFFRPGLPLLACCVKLPWDHGFGSQSDIDRQTDQPLQSVRGWVRLSHLRERGLIEQRATANFALCISHARTQQAHLKPDAPLAPPLVAFPGLTHTPAT